MKADQTRNLLRRMSSVGTTKTTATASHGVKPTATSKNPLDIAISDLHDAKSLSKTSVPLQECN